jgi:hypothetical protein
VTAELVYVYAILPAEAGVADRIAAAGLRGIDEAPVRWLGVGEEGLGAAVSDLAAGEFPVDEQLMDLAWLGPRAVAHQAVNARLQALTEAVVPLSFGTVFAGEERVRQLLHSEARLFRERLAAVRGREEWVVMVHADAELASRALEQTSPRLADLHRQIAASGPGRAHLLRKRLEEVRREELARGQAEAAQAVLAELAAAAEEVFPEPVPDEVVPRPIARASVLVQHAQQVEFLDTLTRVTDQWGSRGYRVEATGPWPPYRFAGLRAEAAGAG